jgi:chromosome segregation ATPase
MDMVTADELEPRVRVVEEEAAGEQLVTRHILKETRQNSGDLATIRAQLTHLQGDMILANAALNNHGVRLDQLTRDVTAIRNDVTALRRGQEEIHARLDRQDSRLDTMDSRLDRVESRLDTMDSRLDRMDSRLDVMDGRLEAIERNTLAILAAVAPGAPPPA